MLFTLALYITLLNNVQTNNDVTRAAVFHNYSGQNVGVRFRTDVTGLIVVDARLACEVGIQHTKTRTLCC